MSRLDICALGFRAHSGWAAMVAVAGPLRSPSAVDRRRIQLAEAAIPSSTQPYHAAQGLDLKQADQLVKRCAEAAQLLARQAMREVLKHLRDQGYEVAGCGILLASGRPITTLASTLASHALIHSAEGELFREALRRASQHHDLPVVGVKERELWTRGVAELGIGPNQLQRQVTDLGKNIGRPWRQDEKYAALAGWIVLAGVYGPGAHA